MTNMIRLPLKNAYNVRDLGGYATHDNKVTKWKRFLRSDALTNIDEQDSKLLNDYGIKTILDLRSFEEVKRRPNNLSYLNDIDYVNIPLLGDILDNRTWTLESMENISVGQFYVELLKQKDLVRSAMEVIAKARDGGVLFHCHAGKDRTGIIAMLLLGLAGVYNQDIISNYQITFTNLNQNNFFSGDKYINTPFVKSHPDNIICALQYLEEQYTNIEGYLEAVGLSGDQRTLIKNRIV